MSSTFSTGKGSTSDSGKAPTASERGASCRDCCDIDIHIDSRGDVNIYNCSTPTPSRTDTPPPSICPPCFPPYGTCIPVVAGAKHKLSREQKLKRLAEGVPVPSSLAAANMHMIRRFLLGKTAANPLEATAFATLSRIPRNILACTIAAFDAMPPNQRNRLFAQSLLLDPDQPIDGATLSAALAQEIKQRIGVQVFDDPNGADQERPGRMRVYEPQGEDFFSQVRICTVNGLRTANFIPPINIDDYLPAEIQQDCEIKVVDGQAQSVCQNRTTDCPGNTLAPVCAVVLDVALGDSVVLQGVNYFSVDAKVRFIDKQTGTPVRDVDSHVWGDVDTPVTDGNMLLVNDCRVHDRLTFQVPDDLAPAIYQIQVVVPNITGISAFGNELVSNIEFLNLIPPATARFEMVTEAILAREETSPAWLGSDEVGLRTLAAAFDLNFNLVDLPNLHDPNERVSQQVENFKDIQNVDFDSGTLRDITRKVFEHDQPILGMLIVVLGDEIDSQRAYDQEITSSLDYFVDLVKEEWKLIAGELGSGLSLILKVGIKFSVIATSVALALTAGIDALIAWWAPADPIIRDSIGLSINDLATLTSANSPAPDPRTFSAEDGIVVNVNKLDPPLKLPLEYHETREYVSDDQDSRYEIRYRFKRVA